MGPVCSSAIPARESRKRRSSGSSTALYRVNSSRGGDGDLRLGLGLSIARQIAEAHDAELSAASHAAEGSEFSVRFPYRPA